MYKHTVFTLSVTVSSRVCPESGTSYTFLVGRTNIGHQTKGTVRRSHGLSVLCSHHGKGGLELIVGGGQRRKKDHTVRLIGRKRKRVETGHRCGGIRSVSSPPAPAVIAVTVFALRQTAAPCACILRPSLVVPAGNGIIGCKVSIDQTLPYG